MKNLFSRLRLAYLKWRHPLRDVSGPGQPEETALVKSLEVRYPGDRLEVAPEKPSIDDLARAYVRGEFERLLREASFESVKVPPQFVARPDEESTEYRWRWDWEGKTGREWQSVSLRIAHDGLLRIIAGVDLEDPIFLTVVAHRTTPIEVNISSLLYASAEDPVTVWVFSQSPFKVVNVSANLRLSQETIKSIRERIADETGVLASLPAPGSFEGRKLYSQHPEWIP